jgi:hypothetical protein
MEYDKGRSRLLIGLVLAFSLMILAVSGCDSGSDAEAKYQKALNTVNDKWEIYEMTTKGDSTIIRVEVDDNVPFKISKKAGEAIQKVDPAFNGYIEFFNSEVGIVLRKTEIFPATPAT